MIRDEEISAARYTGRSMSLLSLMLLPILAQTPSVETQLAEIEAAAKGHLGAAVITKDSRHYSRKDERFSLQSVMKMVVSMAALDLVGQGKWKLDQKFTFRRSDLSVSWQPLIEKLGDKDSMTVTVAECIEITTQNSCSAAGDFLIRKMGGTQVVNAFLKKHKIEGMSVDRQERDLQTQVGGTTWSAEMVDPAKFESALDCVPETLKDEAYLRYQRDKRDTTTPAAMGLLLEKLVTGKLLSPRLTQYYMGVMEGSGTGPDRLKAGVPAGWILGHKTGTSSTHKGLAWATNDVGYARRPSGEWVVIVGLLRGSRLEYDERETILRQVAEVALRGR
jgi:beta-lactamase class A